MRCWTLTVVYIGIGMFGFTSSQNIEMVVVIASLILYFCGITSEQQNAWIFIFSISLLCLIVGKHLLTQTSSS